MGLGSDGCEAISESSLIGVVAVKLFLRVFPFRFSRVARFSSRSAHGRRMMGSGERDVSICFTTFRVFARRLWTLNEIALPIVPTGTIGIHLLG